MISVGILVFDRVSSQAVSGIYQAFADANGREGGRRYRCFLLAERLRPVEAIDGMKLLPDCVLIPTPDIDVLIIPDGDAASLGRKPAVIDWLRFQASEAAMIAGLGAGAELLSTTGLAVTEYADAAELAWAATQQWNAQFHAHGTQVKSRHAGTGLFSAA